MADKLKTMEAVDNYTSPQTLSGESPNAVTPPSGDLKPEARIRKPTRWRCRRGMKELDVLLERYYDSQFEQSGDIEKAAFATLLCMPDPTLMDFVMGRQEPKDRGIKNVLAKICRPHD